MRKRIVVALGGAMYALFAAFGWQAERYGESRPLMGLLAAVLLWPIASGVLALLLKERPRRQKEQTLQGGFSPLKAFAAILCCYVPMFLITFPGSFAYDVPFQLEQVFTGQYSTHHPLLHTLLLGWLVKLGHSVGSINLGAAAYTVLQMTALAACFAMTCASIARQSDARSARWSTVFFALYPLHMMMAVNVTKDVLFSGLFVLTLALAREALLLGMNRKLGAALVLCGAGMMLLRNNALYAVVVWIVLLALLCGRRGLKVCGAMLLAAMLCACMNSGMQRATNAADGSISEMLSWPIQQMARARNLHGDRLEGWEKQAVNELMPDACWAKYLPTISDPVKFDFDTERFLSDPAKYAKAYVSIGMKCPKAYFDALLMHTYSFFYPYSEYRVAGYYLQMQVSDEHYDWCDFERISSESFAPKLLSALSWRFGAKGAMQIPVLGWLFNMGVIVWVMLYDVIREAYHGRWRSFACALLPVLLWGTFLLGPVMAGRYVYPFVCCLPVMASRTNQAS